MIKNKDLKIGSNVGLLNYECEVKREWDGERGKKVSGTLGREGKEKCE